MELKKAMLKVTKHIMIGVAFVGVFAATAFGTLALLSGVGNVVEIASGVIMMLLLWVCLVYVYS